MLENAMNHVREPAMIDMGGSNSSWCSMPVQGACSSAPSQQYEKNKELVVTLESSGRRACSASRSFPSCMLHCASRYRLCGLLIPAALQNVNFLQMATLFLWTSRLGEDAASSKGSRLARPECNYMLPPETSCRLHAAFHHKVLLCFGMRLASSLISLSKSHTAFDPLQTRCLCALTCIPFNSCGVTL